MHAYSYEYMPWCSPRGSSAPLRSYEYTRTSVPDHQEHNQAFLFIVIRNECRRSRVNERAATPSVSSVLQSSTRAHGQTDFEADMDESITDDAADVQKSVSILRIISKYAFKLQDLT